MPCLSRNKLSANSMNFPRRIFNFIGGLLLTAALLLFLPSITHAKIDITYQDGIPIQRSLESLRDLDFHTWQVVAYSTDEKKSLTVLRIIGYPGSLRLNHPQPLVVRSGIKEWELNDITLNNIQLANDSREAAAEFNLKPLLLDLTQNRPLRLVLPNAFNELPVPPYVVKEWRSLKVDNLNHEEG